MRDRCESEHTDHLILDEGNGSMGIGDKAKHNAEDALGNAKEGVGKATDDESLEQEGRADQAKADLKKAGDKLKDAFEN